VRRASPEEVERWPSCAPTRSGCAAGARLVEQHGLKMKVTECEWQWDKNKLTLYFTAERRVDFRQLVRDLARTFRTRIELKQIGVRDEAALLGGVGRCGRELCCSTWLREIKPISLQLAKDQNLSLNPAADLRHLRPADVLPHLRARRLSAGAQALPARGEDRANRARAGEGDRHRHLPRAGHAAGRVRQRRIVSLTELRAETAETRSARLRGAAPEPAARRAQRGGHADRAEHRAAPRPRRRRRGKRAAGSPRNGGRRTDVPADKRRQGAAAGFYITTAIDYANGDPHLGHAFEKIGADAIARYRRLRGDDVHFLMGMDEHGQKVAQTAAAPGSAAAAGGPGRRRLPADLGAARHLARPLHPHHRAAPRRGVRALIERIFERNPDDFYERAYEGWYCVGCELFKREDEIEEGRCVLHPTRELEWTEERNWFFRLSATSPFLRTTSRGTPGFLEPESRRNEVLALLESGLEDISVSRSRLDWAIPFPRPTSDRRDAGHLGLVRRAPQLPDRHRVSGRRGTSGSGPRSCT
jgi:hypothetical protein